MRPEFEDWLRQRFGENVTYDRMVRALLRVRGEAEEQRSGYVFLQANEFKPANLAGSSARMLL